MYEIFMYGIETEDRVTALAAALSYWAFRCRDKAKSPAMGLKTWEYFQSSIQNAAIPSRNIDDYLENIAKKLIVPHLNPREWTRIITGQTAQWVGWQDILNSLKSEGISDRHILKMCREKSHIITTFCRVRFESDRAQNIPDESEALDVEVTIDA